MTEGRVRKFFCHPPPRPYSFKCNSPKWKLHAMPFFQVTVWNAEKLLKPKSKPDSSPPINRGILTSILWLSKYLWWYWSQISKMEDPLFAAYLICPPFWNDSCNNAAILFQYTASKKDNHNIENNRPRLIGGGVTFKILELWLQNFGFMKQKPKLKLASYQCLVKIHNTRAFV